MVNSEFEKSLDAFATFDMMYDLGFVWFLVILEKTCWSFLRVSLRIMAAHWGIYIQLLDN